MTKMKISTIGFSIGFVGTFVVTFAALILPVDIFAKVFLYFPRLILSPLNDAMAGWPGLINMLLGAVVNGLGLMSVFWLAAGIFDKIIPARHDDI